MSFPIISGLPAWAALPCLFHLGAAREISFPGWMWTLAKWNVECILLILIFGIVDIYIVLCYQRNTGFSKRKWPPSGTLRLFQKCANFPLLTLPSLLLLLPEKGRAIWRRFLLLAFSESRELVHTYTFHRKGPVLRTLLYPGFLIPLAVLTSRERWGHFQPPSCVCK